MNTLSVIAIMAMLGTAAGGTAFAAGNGWMAPSDPVAGCGQGPGPYAQLGNASQHQYRLLQDDDGDGIPNGQDEDWVPPMDGTGFHHRHRLGMGSFAPLPHMQDADGDGIPNGQDEDWVPLCQT